MLDLEKLVVNRANDRHGELENETAAIAWLFNNREQHMRNLAKDIVERGEVYEPPLVAPDGSKFIVFDGNRRITCLKVLSDPRKAPNVELQKYFSELRSKWHTGIPRQLYCQVEDDRDRVDEILYRRHTGSQNGVGQSTWDDRMKFNFINRTGKKSGFNVAEEIERKLASADLLPINKKIPRSTLNRLLSSEAFRNRVGFSIHKGKFEFTHDESSALTALRRIAHDLANQKVVLGHVWDVDGKRAYLDKLESEGILPDAAKKIVKPSASPAVNTEHAFRRPTSSISKPAKRITLIPQTSYAVAWAGRLQRHRSIWDELQFNLHLGDHPNAISVLFRVLLELSVDNYISQSSVSIGANDKLHMKVLKAAQDLNAKGKIDDKYLGVFKKFQQLDHLVSADTLNRYVHSTDFAPSPDHLTALWDTLANFIVLCLNA